MAVGSHAEHSSSYGKGRERECEVPSLPYPNFIPHMCPANGPVQPTFKEGSPLKFSLEKLPRTPQLSFSNL